jgi:chromosome partitioning protein
METLMRTILVLNSKGGCGKSMLATNLAAHYALQGKHVALADFDPQASSLEWLKARPKDRPAIEGLAGAHEAVKPARHTEVLILDAPAGIHGAELTALVRRAQTILIPVLPSATDIRATAHFIHDLLLVGKVERKQTRLATIANRVPEIGARDRMLNTLGIDTLHMRLFRPLQNFLERLRIPFITALPDSPCYALADQQGLSIFEIREDRVALDRAAWQPLLLWLDSRQSLPRQ